MASSTKLTFGKAIAYGLVGVLSASAAFGIPEVMNLTGVAAYLPAVVLGGVGVAVARKRPFLGLAIAAPALGGALAPLVVSHALPSSTTPTTGAIEGTTIGDRLGAKRIAALIQGMGAVTQGQPRGDVLTMGR